jgi:DNA-binding NarL/FixJ family response regulator
MYVLKSAKDQHREDVTSSGSSAAVGSGSLPSAISDGNGFGPQGDAATLRQDVPAGWVRNGASVEHQTLIYLDPRAFTRDCVGGWLQSSVSGFDVRILSDPNQIDTAPIVSGQIRAVIINTGSERMSSTAVARLVSRVSELLPEIPVAVLSDYEDSENIRQAFELGVRGYIPTSLASMVAVRAVHLVCVGGTFAPPAALLVRGDRPKGSAGEALIEGFTQRQGQILDCLRRGMANKLIAYELNMCESTVKVHVRNIMKKLKATNRTQVAYLTRSFFEGIHEYESA